MNAGGLRAGREVGVWLFGWNVWVSVLWASLSLTPFFLEGLCLFSHMRANGTFLSTQGFWLMTAAAWFSDPDSQRRMLCSSLGQIFTVGLSTMITLLSVKGPSLGCLSLAKMQGHPALNTCDWRWPRRKAILRKGSADYAVFALKSTRLQSKSILLGPLLFYAHLWIFEVLTL